MTMLNFFLTVIIATILYANGKTVREGILAFARRLAGRRGEDVAILAAKAVRGVVLGVVVTALIQAALGGVGLFLTGVPAAALLTAVMLMLCLAQLGPFLVLVPAVIWLYWSGHPVAGTVLLVIAVVAGTSTTSCDRSSSGKAWTFRSCLSSPASSADSSPSAS